MAESKTKVNKSSVRAFIDGVADPQKRADAHKIDAMMRKATGETGKMWGKAIVGYGTFKYVYASGRSGEWMQVGFSPRKANLTLYIMPGFSGYGGLMAKLGKFKTGKSCLYVNKLSDVDLAVLRKLIDASVKHMRKKYSETAMTAENAPKKKATKTPKGRRAAPAAKGGSTRKGAKARSAGGSEAKKATKKKTAKKKTAKKKTAKKKTAKKKTAKKKTAKKKTAKKKTAKGRRAAPAAKGGSARKGAKARSAGGSEAKKATKKKVAKTPKATKKTAARKRTAAKKK